MCTASKRKDTNGFLINMAEIMTKKLSLGIVGVRGYVGRELIRLLANHPTIKVEWVSSRLLKGITLNDFLCDDEHFEAVKLDADHYYNTLKIETLSEVDVADCKTDIIVLALPNGLAETFLQETDIKQNNQLIIDLSADYRFDETWQYSIPELFFKSRSKQSNIVNKLNAVVKISNPGCYATAMQIALAPLVNHISERANCFGISGFSGAGTKPSANNNPQNLKDNILPYGLIEHLHEKEVSDHLGIPISFSPHVAQFFRGISMTVQVELEEKWTLAKINKLFNAYYKDDSLINVQHEIPNVQQVINRENCIVGGFTLSADGKRLTLVSCLDNLLKGAASQALQNIELFYNECGS